VLVQDSISPIQHKMLFNIVTLLALAPSVLSAVTENGDKKKRSVVPGGYIVEFEDVMSIASDVCLISQLEDLPIDSCDRPNPVSIPIFQTSR
jgi:hypothetical protein